MGENGIDALCEFVCGIGLFLVLECSERFSLSRRGDWAGFELGFIGIFYARLQGKDRGEGILSLTPRKFYIEETGYVERKSEAS